MIFTLEIPLGKRDPEKSPKSDADQVAEDTRKLQADQDARQKKQPDELPKISGDPASPLEKGKGPPIVLGTFDLSRTEGGKPMDLAAMARKLKPLSDGRTGRLHVVAFWSEPLGDDQEVVAKKAEVLRNLALARATKTVAALKEFFKPNFGGRIDQEVANNQTSPLGFSSESVDHHEMVVIFIP